jgi:diguanylate cyclase (GGDEF)-like protein
MAMIPIEKRSFRYALLGGALGLGSPLGLLLIRRLIAMPGLMEWASHEASAFGGVYLYTGLGTAAVFSLMGYVLGRESDALSNKLGSMERDSAEAHRLAITDGLTGLYVHRHLMERLKEELARAKRYHCSLACLFIDVDNLKALNDRHGHLFGDQALTAVANVISSAVRATDVLGRYGGDEFVAVLLEADAEQAYAAAERIRRSVRSLSLDTSSGPAPMTVSVGVYAPSPLPSSPDLLLEMADAALRRSKEQGRDRTTVNEVRSAPHPADFKA